MAPSSQTALGVLGAVSAYAVWNNLVVKRAAKSPNEWGPRSLAEAISWVPNRIGKYLMAFTFNEAEQVADGKIDPSGQYMLVWHPHGVFTINSLFFFTHESAKRTILGKPLFCGVADFLFKVPGLAEFLLLCNAKHVGAKTTEDLLAKGVNVGVNPGGVHEQINTDHTKEVVFFPGKLGFVRLAIKYGVPMLPCYNFGENQLFHTSDFVRDINKWAYKKFGVGNAILHGRFGIIQTPFLMNPLVLPDPGKELNCRIGEAVEVGPPDDNPSEEKVQELFLKYCAALNKLFDEHKDRCLIPAVAAGGLEFHVRGMHSKL